MSSSYQSYSSTSYTTTSSSNGGAPVTKSSHEQVHSSSTDGTTISRSTAETGKPTQTETTHHPPAGGIASNTGNRGQIEQGRVEEIDGDNESEADRRYRENIEDEYAKREGGA